MTEFQLTKQPAGARKRVVGEFHNRPATQKALLAGLDCLSGQTDLFETDLRRTTPDNAAQRQTTPHNARQRRTTPDNAAQTIPCGERDI